MDPGSLHPPFYHLDGIIQVQGKESLEKAELVCREERAETRLAKIDFCTEFHSEMIWVFFFFFVILCFSQDAQRGGTLSDLGKQGEVLGTQAAQASQD